MNEIDIKQQTEEEIKQKIKGCIIRPSVAVIESSNGLEQFQAISEVCCLTAIGVSRGGRGGGDTSQ